MSTALVIPSSSSSAMASSSSSSAVALIPKGSNSSLESNRAIIIPEELALEARAVLNELQQQKLMRREFEQRMEAKLSALEGENAQLKNMFVETHQRTIQMQERLLIVQILQN